MKKELVAEMMAEAKAEVIQENEDRWVGEIKAKLITLRNAEKLVANCKREIADLEIRISEEL